jgi:hypothetical protein
MTILGERLDARHFAGMALIALGLVAIDGRWVGSLARWSGGPRRAMPRTSARRR